MSLHERNEYKEQRPDACHLGWPRRLLPLWHDRFELGWQTLPPYWAECSSQCARHGRRTHVIQQTCRQKRFWSKMVVTTMAKLVPALSSHPPSRPHGPIHGWTRSPGDREAHFLRQPLLLTWLHLPMVIQPNILSPASQDLVQSSSREAVQPEGCLAWGPPSQHPPVAQESGCQGPPSLQNPPGPKTFQLKFSAWTAWKFFRAGILETPALHDPSFARDALPPK